MNDGTIEVMLLVLLVRHSVGGTDTPNFASFFSFAGQYLETGNSLRGELGDEWCQACLSLLGKLITPHSGIQYGAIRRFCFLKRMFCLW